MKTKPQSILILLLIIAVIATVAVFLCIRLTNDTASSTATTQPMKQGAAEPTAGLAAPVIQVEQALTNSKPGSLPPQNGSPSQDKKDIVQSALERMKSDYLSHDVRPIYFYGLVVDERHHSRPVVRS